MLTGSSDSKSTGCLFFPPLSYGMIFSLAGRWCVQFVICRGCDQASFLLLQSQHLCLGLQLAGRVAAMWCQITSCALWSDKEECCWVGNHFLYDAFWRLFALNSGRCDVKAKKMVEFVWIMCIFYPVKRVFSQSAWVCSAKEAHKYNNIEMQPFYAKLWQNV